MKDTIILARKSLRYKRTDISVHVCQGRGRFQYIELLNISQNGMLIRGQINLNLRNYVMSTISFDENDVFDQKCNIVSKIKIKSVESELTKKIWGFFTKDHSVYEYSLVFEDDSSDFKDYLLRSNMEKRLKHHNH